MDRWDIVIILAAGYVAIMTLVRMMARRRNQVIEHVREQIVEQRAKAKTVKQAAEQAERDVA